MGQLPRRDLKRAFKLFFDLVNFEHNSKKKNISKFQNFKIFFKILIVKQIEMS